MTAASWPDHLLTLAEWDALPQDTSRCYELVEGVLLVVPGPITREACAAANPSRLEAADVLVAIEIISPGTGTTDRVTKRYEYTDAGIPHHWLVDLDKPVTLTAYTLVDGNYEHVAGDIAGTVTIPSPVGITLTLDTLITR